MAEYVHLVGAEDVSRAASSMRSAADEMHRAADQITFALEQHQQFLTNWLDLLNATLSDRISDLGVTLGPVQ